MTFINDFFINHLMSVQDQKSTEITYFKFKNNYKERTKRHQWDTCDIAKFQEMVKSPSKIYEVLLGNPVRLFIDIDGVPLELNSLIYEFISDFIMFMNVEFNIHITRYALTKNENSISHKGLSYHVYFPEYYVDKIFKIKYILTLFIKNHEKYYEYVDGCIYHYNRLFRCVGQLNASVKSNNEPDDIHLLQKGTIEDTIIQDCSLAILIPININDEKFRRIKGTVLKNQSFDQEKIKLKKTIKYQKNKIKAQQSIISKFTSFDKTIDTKTKEELMNDLKFLTNQLDITYDGDIENYEKLKDFVGRALVIQRLKKELQQDLINEILNN